MEMLNALIGVTTLQMHTYTEIHQNVHIKYQSKSS